MSIDNLICGDFIFITRYSLNSVDDQTEQCKMSMLWKDQSPVSKRKLSIANSNGQLAFYKVHRDENSMCKKESFYLQIYE